MSSTFATHSFNILGVLVDLKSYSIVVLLDSFLVISEIDHFLTWLISTSKYFWWVLFSTNLLIKKNGLYFFKNSLYLKDKLGDIVSWNLLVHFLNDVFQREVFNLMSYSIYIFFCFCVLCELLVYPMSRFFSKVLY